MAGELEVRIGGVDVTARVSGHPAIDFAINRRGQARITFTDRGGVYRPAVFADCSIYIDSGLVFGGLVQTAGGRELQPLPASPYAAGSVTSVSVTDYGSLVDHVLFNGISPAGPLRTAVAAVIVTLTGTGALTFGPGPMGPEVPAFGFSFKYVREALDTLCQLAGWTWVIDASRYLWVRPGGSVPAPRNLSVATAKLVGLSWEQTGKDYRSHQFVHFGETGVRPYTLSAVSDGVRRIYPLIGVTVTGEIRPTAPVPTVTVGAATLPVSYVGDPDHAWWYREEPGAVQLEVQPAFAVPAAGTVITATFEAQFPGVVWRSQAGAYVARIDTLTTTDDPIAASQYADALLRQYGVMPRTVQLETRWLDFRPGQTVTVNFPPWDLAGITCLIDTVQIVHGLHQRAVFPVTGSHQWISRLTLVEGDETRGSWLDFWRQALTVGAGASFSTGGAPGSGGGGGGPVFVSGGPTYGGGSRAVAITHPALPSYWQPVPEFVDVLLPASTGSLLTYTFRCHAWLVRAGGTVTVRVVALESGGIVCGTGTAKSATDWSDPQAFHEFTVTLRPATQYYRVEVQLSVAGNEAYIAGCLFYPG